MSIARTGSAPLRVTSPVSVLVMSGAWIACSRGHKIKSDLLKMSAIFGNILCQDTGETCFSPIFLAAFLLCAATVYGQGWGTTVLEKEEQMVRMNRRDVLKMAAASAAGLVGVRRAPLVNTVIASDRYSTAVLTKGPVGYWRLGEDAGPTAADASGNAYDGEYLGNPTFGQPGAIVNDPDPAIGCNGPDSQDYIEILDPISKAFSQPTSGLGLTVEVWMRPDLLIFPGQTADPYIHWLGKGMPSRFEWAFRFYSQESTRPNRISAYIWNLTGGLGAGAYFQDELVPGAWIHIVACYEPGDKDTIPSAGVHIYKDGVHRLGPPSPGTLYSTYDIVPAHGTAPLRLGTRDSLSFLLTGGLDEVAIYPRVLTGAEILENYTTGVAD